ncbi:alpha/beta fold hydrolase [Microbacterium trichothecenolyticum]
MSVTTRRMQDLTIDDHFLTVPLVWGDPADGRTIDIHAAVVARDGGESLPYLVFLQGGPGHEAPRAFHSPSGPSWLDTALEHYRVVMLDQRGTGLSSPVGDDDLARDAAELAEYITHLRADAIVRDCEAVRQHLGAERWSVLGQSFGGFTTLAYLSTDAASLEHVFITGGLSAVGRHPDDVYALTYDKMREESEKYYRRFPAHRDAMRRVIDLALDGELVLPGGEVASVSRVRSVGSALGTDDGWQTLWGLLERDPRAPTPSVTTSPRRCRSARATRCTSCSTSRAMPTATPPAGRPSVPSPTTSARTRRSSRASTCAASGSTPSPVSSPGAT